MSYKPEKQLDKPTVLFIAAPNHESKILFSDEFNSKFNTLTCIPESKDSFLKFLADHQTHDIRAIYGGYPAFVPIGGLTSDLIEYELFPKHLKCIVVCSRGHNGFDLDCLRKHGIQLYNYQDDKIAYGNKIKDFQTGQVGNDVADCALWHVLEGFRKFSYQQSLTRKNETTLAARSEASGKPGFAFGHELQNMKAESPRGKKCLILGLGSIGKCVGLKLHYGLGMEIHYSKRTQDLDVAAKHGWTFHKLDDTIYKHLWQFNAIVIALPLTKETEHLVDDYFLSHCNGPELIIVNVARGNILHRDEVHKALQNGKLRHIGEDVFYNEPIVDQELKKCTKNTTITPHIGSSTAQVFYQSCEFALANILAATGGEQTDSLSRIA